MRHATIDVETYSEAGYMFDEGYFKKIISGGGLALVGAAAYSEHSSTEVISLAYSLHGGETKLWAPGADIPIELLAHIEQGGLVEAHNAMFEYFIWLNVLHLRMGWPMLPIPQLRCSQAKARAFNIPGGLLKATEALGCAEIKDKAGKALIDLLSMPRKPTLADPNLRCTLQSHPVKFMEMYAYNIQDVVSEMSLSEKLPDLLPIEQSVFLLNNEKNARGVAIDTVSLDACQKAIDTATPLQLTRFRQLTSGVVDSPTKLAQMKSWLLTKGVEVGSLDKQGVDILLKRDDLPADCREILEIRKRMGLSSVTKLVALKHRVCKDSRVRGLFEYCGADRTGRFAGRGPQPQNLPSNGPEVHLCGCGAYYAASVLQCPSCSMPATKKEAWSPEASEFALSVLRDGKEGYFPDAFATVSGCLRSLFVAGPGKRLICSDYSAIEGVVAAMLSGEQWRIDVFRDHGAIYEMSASKITGVPFAEIMDHKKRTGEHHPVRGKIGKYAELASGFGGWLGAWKQFGADKYLSDEEIKKAILSWRAASPAIVEMWGGQSRKDPTQWEFTPELFGLEGCIVMALLHKGAAYGFRGIVYQYSLSRDILYCKLLSGRFIHYHTPKLEVVLGKSGLPEYKISYKGVHKSAWCRMGLYGGRAFANVVQATARDILVHAMINVEKEGYPIVLDIHDELVVEVPHSYGSVSEFEKIMGVMPPWAEGWPIRANGGWAGQRFRKA